MNTRKLPQEALNRWTAGKGVSGKGASVKGASGKGSLVGLIHTLFICGLCISASACAAQTRVINIPPGELSAALEAVAQQADVELIFQPDQLKGLHTDGLVGMMTAQQATKKLLAGTNLQLRTDPDNGAMMVGTAPAATEPSPPKKAGTVALTPEEEVIVRARRAELSAMRAEMVKLEDRFYSEYNRLNTNHWWDVLCHRDKTAANGRFTTRVCAPRFVEQGFRYGVGSPGGGTETAPPTTYVAVLPPFNKAAFLKKWADYQQNMTDQIIRSPELRRLVSERETLGKRYEATRKQAFKGKIIVLD